MMISGLGVGDYGQNRFEITSLDCFSNLTNGTKEGIENLYIQHMCISSLSGCLDGFSNLKVLRCEYNSLISLKGIENCKKLEYLFANKQTSSNFGKDEVISNYTENDALASIEKLSKLIYINLSNNSTFKWSKYLKDLNNLEYLNLDGCSGILDFSQLASLANRLGEKCSYPGEMASSLIGKDSKILNLKGSIININDFKKLKGAQNLYALNLNGAKIVEDNNSELDSETYNSVINEVLSTCTNMNYLEISKQPKLNSIDFVKNMKKLKELYLDGDSSLTDLSIIENMANEGTLELYLLVLSNSNIDLTKIQKTISIVSENCFAIGNHYNGNILELDLCGFWYSSRVLSESDSILGVIISDNTLLQKLSTCAEITSLYIRPGWRGIFIKSIPEKLNLSNCSNLKKFFYSGYAPELVLPENLEEFRYGTSNFISCDLGLCKKLKIIRFICVTGNDYLNEILSTLPEDYNALEYLELLDQDSGGGKYFSNLDFLKQFENCVNFKKISIMQNGGWSRYKWDNLDGLKYGKNLEDIEILFGTNDGGCLANFPDLSELSKLKHLQIRYGNMNLDNIKTCKNLTDLTINKTYIKNVDFLKDINGLINVDLSDNLIADIEGLKGKTKIQSLKLGNNGVVDISPLKDLISVTHLELNNNKLSDFANDISGNSYYTQTVLTDLNQNNNLKSLYLWGNLYDDYSIIKNEKLKWDKLILDEKDKPED